MAGVNRIVKLRTLTKKSVQETAIHIHIKAEIL